MELNHLDALKTVILTIWYIFQPIIKLLNNFQPIFTFINIFTAHCQYILWSIVTVLDSIK